MPNLLVFDRMPYFNNGWIYPTKLSMFPIRKVGEKILYKTAMNESAVLATGTIVKIDWAKWDDDNYAPEPRYHIDVFEVGFRTGILHLRPATCIKEYMILDRWEE